MTATTSHPKPKQPTSATRALLAIGVAALLLGSCGSPGVDEQGVNANLARSQTTDEASHAEPASGAATSSSTTMVAEEPSSGQQRSGTEIDKALPVYPTGITPTRLEIPTIGVDAPTIDLDLRGPEPEVPIDFDDAGWYQQTRLPGEIGPAVIAGHIDSTNGPAVFARLNELGPGDEIIVHDDEGGRRVFIVDRAGQYPKTALPSEVFGFDLPVPELRLITCGGAFDRTSGHYRDNYVVYAVPADEDL